MPTPGDLLNKHFEKSGFGGYKAADVDSYMVDVASEISKAKRETLDFKRKLEAAEKKIETYKAEEESIKNTLLSAQRLADRIIKDAQTSSEITIRDAQIKSEIIIEKAREEIELRHSESNRIKQEVSEFKIKVMRMYRTHLELINTLPSEDVSIKDNNIPAELKETQEKEETVENEQAVVVEMAENEAAAAATEYVASPEDSSENKQEEKPPLKSAQKASEDNNQEAPVVKLNLKYNEITGEYEPITTLRKKESPENAIVKHDRENFDGIKFGNNYDISTDSFKDLAGK